MPSTFEAPHTGLSAGGQQQNQSQTQTQTQSIEISVGSAGDVDFENRVFRNVHSVGRQLARLSEVVCVLVEKMDLAQELQPVQAPLKALSNFRHMREDIRRERKERDDGLIRSIEEMRDKDPARYAALAERLRELVGPGGR